MIGLFLGMCFHLFFLDFGGKYSPSLKVPRDAQTLTSTLGRGLAPTPPATGPVVATGAGLQGTLLLVAPSPHAGPPPGSGFSAQQAQATLLLELLRGERGTLAAHTQADGCAHQCHNPAGLSHG